MRAPSSADASTCSSSVVGVVHAGHDPRGRQHRGRDTGLGDAHQQLRLMPEREHLGDRALGHQPAAGDDRDAVAHLLHLAEQVAGHEDRPALRRRATRMSSRNSLMPAGSRPFEGSSRISSAGILQQRGREPEPLAHPERVALHAGRPPAPRARPARASRRPPAARSLRAGPSSSRLLPGRERREQRRASRRWSRPAPSPGRGGAAPRRRASRPGRRSAGRARARSGSWSSSRTRWARGSRRPRPRAPRDRARRWRPSSPAGTACGARRARSPASGRTLARDTFESMEGPEQPPAPAKLVVRLLDELAGRATAPALVRTLDGWQLRSTPDAPFRRANSVLPNGELTDGRPRRRDRRRRGVLRRAQPTRRGSRSLTPRSHPSSIRSSSGGATRSRRRSSSCAPAQRSSWRARKAKGASPPSAASGSGSAANAALHGDVQDARERVLAYGRAIHSLKGPATAVVAPADGPAVAIGFAVLDRGWTGIFGMGTRPEARRRGAATAILHTLTAVGRRPRRAPPLPPGRGEQRRRPRALRPRRVRRHLPLPLPHPLPTRLSCPRSPPFSARSTAPSAVQRAENRSWWVRCR